MVLVMGVNKLVIILMTIAQSTYVAIAHSYKYAVNNGVSLRVIISFRLLLAMGFLVPCAYISYRRSLTLLPYAYLIL